MSLPMQMQGFAQKCMDNAMAEKDTFSPENWIQAAQVYCLMGIAIQMIMDRNEESAKAAAADWKAEQARK